MLIICMIRILIISSQTLRQRQKTRSATVRIEQVEIRIGFELFVVRILGTENSSPFFISTYSIGTFGDAVNIISNF